jgi:hypothetical protein
MADYTNGPARPREGAAALAAANDIERDVALALSRATARTLRALSDEADEIFKAHIQREIDRLRLSGPGGPDLAVMRLREFLRG